MSYARSPRPVCSITIGTSIIFGSFTFTCHTPASPTKFICEGGSKVVRFLCGLVIQKVEGLLVADSVSNPIERPIACQTCAHRFRRLFRLRCERFYFTIDFLIADLDFLQIRDPVQQQRSLNLLHCLVALPGAQA